MSARSISPDCTRVGRSQTITAEDEATSTTSSCGCGPASQRSHSPLPKDNSSESDCEPDSSRNSSEEKEGLILTTSDDTLLGVLGGCAGGPIHSESGSVPEPIFRRHQRQHSSSSMSEVEGELAEMERTEKPKAQQSLSRQRKTKSLYGASPSCKFGPKASLMKNQDNVLTIQDPASQRLSWYRPPLSVLIIKKVYDDGVIQPFVELCSWLLKEKKMVVFVELSVLDEVLLTNHPQFAHIKTKLCTFTEGKDDLTDKVDLIVTLGGDGTLLYASSLFQQSVPPLMAFHLGSLGFLSPFEYDHSFREKVSSVLEGRVPLILRHRLKCVVCTQGTESANQPSVVFKNSESKQHIMVLNEVVVDRGPSAYLCNIDLYIEHRYITSVQGDGVIISTPTGSTAYSAAAGASMVHPNVPAIIITPICPHSLSFRPIVVPAGIEIKIMLSPSARNNAWVSFDGRNRQEITKYDTLRISTSIYPLPSICGEDQISDWFDGLASCLHWNVRKQQKSLPYAPSMDSLDSLSISDNGR